MTKQEQIEKIQEIINDCYEVDSFIAAEGSEGGYIDTEEAAKAIVEAGYGNVSEYKSEIERLKAEVNKGCNNCEAVKQAKIDVLAELKAKYGFYSCYSWHCDTKLLSEIIDEYVEMLGGVGNEN